MDNGTIAKQEPDGREIVASMKRAVISNDKVEWYETCFCNQPLRHERATVYDQFFHDMEINPVETMADLKGERFWDYLQRISQRRNLTFGESVNPAQLRYVPLRIL